MQNKPFRITLEHWDEKIVIERSTSDIDSTELKEILMKLCMAAGWSEDNVKNIFGEYED